MGNRVGRRLQPSKGCWSTPNSNSLAAGCIPGPRTAKTLATSSAPRRSRVTATNSIDDILALDADAVIYAPLLPSVDEVSALLRSGKNVVTPLGWFYPTEKEAAPLEVAAQAGNATLHGAGIGPGAATELFPAAAAGDVHRRNFCSGRRVFRSPHLWRARRAALRGWVLAGRRTAR